MKTDKYIEVESLEKHPFIYSPTKCLIRYDALLNVLDISFEDSKFVLSINLFHAENKSWREKITSNQRIDLNEFS